MSSTARRAPAVRFPVRRSRAVGGVLAALALAGGAALLAWWLVGAGRGALVAAAGAAAWLAAVAAAWHWWLGQFCGELRWDGQQWWLDRLLPGGSPMPLKGAPEVQWDLQDHLWVCAHATPGRARTWLWLECRQQPERWPDLRRAVYSRAGTGTVGAAEFAPIHSREA
ncbi:hypothetical protein PMI14_00205 [Acidovorax sp. CF316]|uniref:hypothetical protein n=1 Tax=Acidovorax sp. CF316 TaxID=1144317 RepID=UPI00026BE478|nr:hypothetical protein [Acidovorax sp. CF316]EJE54852.1 hypothetical protein PMI14_00205 [Acidovorax sp. CF316]